MEVFNSDSLLVKSHKNETSYLHIPKRLTVTDSLYFVSNVMYIHPYILHPATLLIRELCLQRLDPTEAEWKADCGSSMMDCMYTVFHKQKTMLPGPGQP